jgi:hypothetical protein
MRHSLVTRQKYFTLLGQGMSQAEACRTVKITPKTARAWELGMKDDSGKSYAEKKKVASMRGPVPKNELCKEAAKSLDDFERFRRNYYGRVSSPWQIDAAYKFVQYLQSDRREYVILNCPPGAGKSTLLNEIEAWLTCNNRKIRGLIGSKTGPLAMNMNLRLKRALEAPMPPQADYTQIAAGKAVQAIASLSQHYGRFQPDRQDLWRQAAFVVAQLGEEFITEKEPTWQSYGWGSDYLGNRLDIAVWDDAMTMKDLRTQEGIQTMQQNWDSQAENRIEPWGAIFNVQQRLGPEDLSGYNLKKPAPLEDEYDDDDDIIEPYEITPEGSTMARKYHHVKYPAHDDTRCTGDKVNHNRKTAPYWAPDNPTACLLDPYRLPYRELVALKEHDPGNYATVYQQEDVNEQDVLVQRVWVTGGETSDADYPGCYDTERGLAEVPEGLSKRTKSIVTIDPSPTKWWSVQWWLYDPVTHYRHLMDIENRKMGAEHLLDFNPVNGEYSGYLDSWAKRAHKLGWPIRELIVERNAAQRFMLKYKWFVQYLQRQGVTLRPHDTTTNKADPDYGVQTIGTNFKYGRVRLPNKRGGGDMGFVASRKLVDEVCVYPHGSTTDNVMAYWFLEFWIPRLNTQLAEDLPNRETPDWLNKSVANLHRGVA